MSRPRGSRLVRVFWLVVVLGGAGAVAWSFRPRPVAVEAAVIGRGPLATTVEDDGKTRLKARFVVSAPLAGRIARSPWHAGDPIEAGRSVLAAIEPGDPALLDARARTEATARVAAAKASREKAEAELERAVATHGLARAELERAARLSGGGSLAREEFDRLDAAERTAAAEVKAKTSAVRIAGFDEELAKAAFVRIQPETSGDAPARLEILSPITGQVLRVFAESEGLVPAGAPLLEVGDPSDLEIVVDVLSSDAVRIREGAPAIVEGWGGEHPLAARVRRVEPTAFTKVSALGIEEQRVFVILDFEGDPKTRPGLGDGFRVEARITVWSAESVLVLPLGALHRSGDRWAVFVVEDGRARCRTIEVGHFGRNTVEVTAGLDAGAAVVLYPGDRVDDGVGVVLRSSR